MIKLAIFDLDGTLLNTIADLGEACNYMLHLHGFPTHAPEEFPKMVGNGLNMLIYRSLPEAHRDMETVLRLKPDFTAYYDTHNRVHTQPYEGIPELLAEMKQRGMRLAVASNKYNEATNALVHYYFGDMFDVVLGERPGVERKPDPQIVADIFASPEMAGISRQQTLYIGDSDVDMQTAKNAGLTSIGCTWGFCTREMLIKNTPDHLVEHPSEIRQFI